MDSFTYSDVESLKNLIKRYAKVIEDQEVIIRNLQARLDESLEPSYDREGMIANLEAAQGYLSEVYHAAIDAGMKDIESLMSSADSCVTEAIDALSYT